MIEDVRVIEKFRTGEYEVSNLSVIDEASSRVLDVGGVRLRLFGLGGAVASHKMCKSFFQKLKKEEERKKEGEVADEYS